MILLLLRHERVHDLLHRFPQIVRTTGPRYRPHFRPRGRRYAARDDSLEITFICTRLLIDFTIFRRAVIAARREEKFSNKEAT